MRTYTAGSAVTLQVPFIQGGQPHVPDAGTAVYTLFDQAGAPVAGHDGADVTVAVHVGTIVIEGASNAVTSSFEKRTVVVSYERLGAPFSIRLVYRLVPFQNFTVSPDEVRSFLGVNSAELPDADIDLVKAYLALQEETGGSVLATALASGEVAEIRANDAMLYWTVLDILPSLQLRIAQQQADGPISFQRAIIRDFERLATEAKARLTTAMNVITGRPESAYPLMITTGDADPITGA